MERITFRSRWPLDLAASSARYVRWGPDPMTVVDGAHVARVVTVAGRAVPYTATQRADGTLEVTSPQPEAALADLRVRLAEDVPRDGIEELAARDQLIGSLYATADGYRPPLEPDPLQSLVTAVSAQQVNLQWATTTRSRLVHRYGTPHRFADLELWEFPAAETLGGADPAEIRELQFTTRKAEYIVGIAAAVSAGRLDGVAGFSHDEVIRRLTSIRGVGRWTADWFLARCLGRPDVIAAGDLGVRKAVSHVYLRREELLSEDDVRDATASWGDGTNWAVHLLLEQLSS